MKPLMAPAKFLVASADSTHLCISVFFYLFIEQIGLAYTVSTENQANTYIKEVPCFASQVICNVPL